MAIGFFMSAQRLEDGGNQPTAMHAHEFCTRSERIDADFGPTHCGPWLWHVDPGSQEKRTEEAPRGRGEKESVVLLGAKRRVIRIWIVT